MNPIEQKATEELKEFLEKNFVDIYCGATRRIISKKKCWIVDLVNNSQ